MQMKKFLNKMAYIIFKKKLKKYKIQKNCQTISIETVPKN